MATEAWLGFTAFATRKATGRDVVDFLSYRQALASGAIFDEALAARVLAAPAGNTAR
jgi:6-oxo-cyclohex-1-ene-carbonyl-CoA hydrolase